MHAARLWKALDNGLVQCRLCSHFCRIPPGERGKCGVRENQGGVLSTLVYDRVAATNVDPIEKKPLYHFLPGSLAFSFGTMGCNLGCSFCQNYTLSQPPREGLPIQGRRLEPQELVGAALESGCASIAYTYSEPTIFFELMEDTARLAQDKGLKNIIVSNGFMSPECLDALAPLVQAANIDLKAFTPDFYADVCQAKLEPVKKNLKHISELGWWLEVTTLVIPGLNDHPDELALMAGFIHDELGADTPWHLSRFHPEYRLLDRPVTPLATLERAWDIGRRAGLNHIYVGNVPGNDHNSTYCPQCGHTVIERLGFAVGEVLLRGGVCQDCGKAVAGRF